MSDCNSIRRIERRILKEFNSLLNLESLFCGKRVFMRMLFKIIFMNLIFWEGFIVLDVTIVVLRDMNIRRRVLKLDKYVNLDRSVMKKSFRM